MGKKTVPVVGMACSACSANVERRLQSLDGVRSASVSLPARTATIEWDEQTISLQQIKSEINSIGYDLIIDESQSVETIERREYTLLWRRTLLAWLLALGVMSLSMGWLRIGSPLVLRQTAFLLALASIVCCGRGFYASAISQLRHGAMSMNTLVMFSTAIALVAGAYDSTAMILAFVLTGKVLEERARRSTASSIKALMGLQPKTVRMADEAGSVVPLSTVQMGDVLEVRAGEKVPVDGLVTWAESFMTPDGAYVDESMLSGEPAPQLKRRMDKAMAGTMVSQGRLHLRAQQVGEQTALAQLIRMVQEAQGSKAPVQRIVDRLAAVFVPVVGVLALLTFVLWLLFSGDIHQAVTSAVAVLVIACPCAMGLATPTALMVGIGQAAKQGILVKDATALELLRKVNALVTDKTGTLTIPNPQIDFTKADSLPPESRESLKPNAREAMEALQRDVDVYLMSGDKEEAVAYWAGRSAIRHWQSQVTPQDKENLVRQLQESGRVVAMVGDGINDSQALAHADVSIAIGQGTDVAMDVAQVTLMTTDLRALPEAVALSRRTVRTIHENLFWAFVYNLVCIPLAAGLPRAFGVDVQITPMWASALMAMSSVSVVLNSLRLKYRNKE